MTSIHRVLSGLYQLSRPDPVASWAGGAFLLGVATAMYHDGFMLLWADGILAFATVIAGLAFGAHGLNDAYDWSTGTDRESIGKGTGGSRVIPEGKLTVIETAAIGVIAIAFGVSIGAYFYLQHGWPVIALTILGAGAPIAYSLPPLKLAYRPFPELVIVTPALVGVTIGSELVLSGDVTWLAFIAGGVHAAFCISWYMVSRIPDYEPDRGVGKTTTVVYLGRRNAPLISAVYLMAGVGIALIGVVSLGWPFVVTPLFAVFLLVGLVYLDPYDPEHASYVRYRQMRTTTVHAIVLAVAIAYLGVT